MSYCFGKIEKNMDLSRIHLAVKKNFGISREIDIEITMQLHKEIKLLCDAMLGAMNLGLDQLGFSWPLTH